MTKYIISIKDTLLKCSYSPVTLTVGDFKEMYKEVF
jgi:hypothetical protein